MKDIDINKLILKLRNRISELEYDNILKDVIIQQLTEDSSDNSKEEVKQDV